MNKTHNKKALSLATLADLPTTAIKPAHARDSISMGILHFGPGNFHRAHQQVYLNKLMSDGLNHDWAVVGASIMPGDKPLRDILIGQDCLGTVVEQSADKSVARVIGAMIDYLPVGDVQAILAALGDPAIRIVSLTVTEGGYFVDAETGLFDPTHPAIVQDAQSIDEPKTIFGIIVNALRQRQQNSLPAFTVMSCDNLPHNGKVAQGAVIGLANLVDPELADWIDKHSSFPNGMVDRIAPATGEREKSMIVSEHGINDGYPVFCEDYLQWVLEDKFVNGRPSLEKVGVQFVDDVAPFETMKIRILNGGHAVIAYPAGLLDIEFADQAMTHPLILKFLETIEQQEIIPTVPPVPDTDLGVYFEHVKTRFANPKIGDTIRRLCLDGSNRQPKFIIPTIRDRIASTQTVDGLALVSALWCRYCYGSDETGKVIEPNDPSWALLNESAKKARKDPYQWLLLHDVYGKLNENEQFVDAFSVQLNRLWADGTESALDSYVQSFHQ